MSTWARHSTTARATSDRIEGPYTHAATVVGTESHNAFYVYSPTDQLHLVYMNLFKHLDIFNDRWNPLAPRERGHQAAGAMN